MQADLETILWKFGRNPLFISLKI